MHQHLWREASTLPSRRYVCGYCSGDITSNLGYKALHSGNTSIVSAYIYLCHNCGGSSYFEGSKQIPGAKLGSAIDHLPQNIAALHDEIRDATAAGANTAAVLAARKLLMHIAVECGADEGKKFVEYVDYLVDNHYAPPNSKVWVDKIRAVGNEANHEIKVMGTDEASSILRFIEMLLRFNYEFPQSAK